MKIELKELSLNDGRDVHEMLQEIGPGENGINNSAYNIAYQDFPSYLKRQVDMSDGIGIDLNIYVPQTTYWLYVNDRPVGICRLRHRLNDNLRIVGGHIGYCIRPSERGKGYGNLILAEVLKKAQMKGINDVLITCHDDNIASRKVIEHNSGVLGDINDHRCRYWIKIL